jgi:hypothetical protein
VSGSEFGYLQHMILALASWFGMCNERDAASTSGSTFWATRFFVPNGAGLAYGSCFGVLNGLEGSQPIVWPSQQMRWCGV